MSLVDASVFCAILLEEPGYEEFEKQLQGSQGNALGHPDGALRGRHGLHEGVSGL
ncbi:MAG: hypothetical protein M9924_22010 [Rhizobiaceae bacterium]|nr:hypothetical protein [Rhizobiaceae bacterium]